MFYWGGGLPFLPGGGTFYSLIFKLKRVKSTLLSFKLVLKFNLTSLKSSIRLDYEVVHVSMFGLILVLADYTLLFLLPCIIIIHRPEPGFSVEL